MPERQQVILVVDDEPQLREIVKFDLRKLGAEILFAENGSIALDIASKNIIDLVISDVRMPVATGVDLLKELRDKNPGHPPFIFMTAFSDISSEEALDLGAEAFLRKPLDKQELLEIVKKALTPRSTRWTQVLQAAEGARVYDLTHDFIASGADTGQIEIGQGGMFIEVSSDLPSSFEVLRFRVNSQDLRPGVFEALGQVRWVRPSSDDDRRSGFGVEFLQMDEMTRQHLLEYLKASEPRAYIPLGKRAAAPYSERT